MIKIRNMKKCIKGITFQDNKWNMQQKHKTLIRTITYRLSPAFLIQRQVWQQIYRFLDEVRHHPELMMLRFNIMETWLGDKKKYCQISNLYKPNQIPKLKCFLSRLAVVFVQYVEARCWVENEDVVGVALTGDAPTTSEWSTILLPSNAY